MQHVYFNPVYFNFYSKIEFRENSRFWLSGSQLLNLKNEVEFQQYKQDDITT